MRRLDWWWIGLLAVISVFGINIYEYGLYNHNVTVPFLKKLSDPNLYPGDPLLGQLDFFYTYFLKGLAALLGTGISMKWLFFILYCLAVFFSLATFYRLAWALTNRREAAVIATMLFLFGFKTIGYINTFEYSLMERTLVLPLELWALERMVRGKWRAAFVLVGFSFLIHPLSSAYVGAMIGLAALLQGRGAYTRILTGLILFVLIASPSLYMKFVGPAPEMATWTPDPDWLNILYIHSAYHVFPSTWSTTGWLKLIGFLAAFWLAVRAVPSEARHRIAWTACAAVSLMCLAAWFVAEVVPLALPIQFQFFRSYRFLQYFGMIYLGWFAVRAVDGDQPWWQAAIALILAAPAWHFMSYIKYDGFLVILLLILPGWFLFRRFSSYSFLRLQAGMTLCLMVFAVLMFIRYEFVIDNRSRSAQNPGYVEAQEWARDNTPVDAGFIVPPNRWGFRIDSERPIYGDWYDGTQTFFDAAFGKSWLRRMEMLGYDGDPIALGRIYRELPMSRFQEIGNDMPACSEVYALWFEDMDGPFEKVAEFGRFKIVQIR